MDLNDLAKVAISDAGGVGMKHTWEDDEGMKHTSEDDEGLPTDHTQGAWIVVAADTLPTSKQKVKASPMSWRSSKLKRKVYSTFDGETQACCRGGFRGRLGPDNDGRRQARRKASIVEKLSVSTHVCDRKAQ